MQTTRHTWYLLIDGHKSGPYDDSGVRRLLGQKRLKNDTLVWTKGMASWKPLRDVPQLQRKEPPAPASPVVQRADPDAKWYYARKNQRFGPFSTRAMIDSIRSGVIHPQQRVWSQHTRQWITAEQAPEFAAALEAARKATDEELWYYKRQNNVKGPFTIDTLRDHVRDGALKIHHPVFSKKLGKWDVVSNIPRLKSALFSRDSGAQPQAKDEEMWYYRRNKATCGPVSTEFLGRHIRKGNLNPDDMVYNKARKKWEKVREAPEMNYYLQRIGDMTDMTESTWQ